MAVGTPWFDAVPEALQLLATFVTGVTPWQAKQAVLDHKALPLSGFAAAKSSDPEDKAAMAMAIWPTTAKDDEPAGGDDFLA
jgi:hypothetical protein